MSVTLTAAEAAKILKISKYTFYELVKRGEIPAYHIGRQLRVEPAVLDAYLKGTVGLNTSQPAGTTATATTPGAPAIRFVGSHDPVIELLFEFLKHSASTVESSVSFKGSIDGLIALYRREAEITGIHLWDEESQDYNISFVKHIVLGESVCIVNLIQREQGFIVAPGNPLNLQTWDDITKEGTQFINRQKGSGTRLRLDTYLKSAKILPARIVGYEHEENTHFGVACRVASGQADVGLGVKAAAQRFGLGFVHLFSERYDLVCLKKITKSSIWKQLMEVLRSPGFIQAVRQFEGYDTSLTGKVLLDE